VISQAIITIKSHPEASKDMIELELTYLAKSLPEGLKDCPKKELLDIYIPKDSPHPKLRLRKRGDVFELTKKEPIDPKDASIQTEHTIPLTKEEFEALSRIEGKRIAKTRFLYNHEGHQAEIDVFQESLKGLVLIDFEFNTKTQKSAFKMPQFCLAGVTQEIFIAGGVICGKSYKDIEPDLKRFGYKRLCLE